MELSETLQNFKHGLESGLTDLVAGTAGAIPVVRDLPFVRDSVELSDLHRRNVHDSEVRRLVSEGWGPERAEESVRRQDMVDSIASAALFKGAAGRFGSLGKSAVRWQWEAVKGAPKRLASAGRKIPGAIRAVRDTPVRKMASGVADWAKGKAGSAAAWSFLSAEGLVLAAGGKYVWDHWLTNNASDEKDKDDRVRSDYAKALESARQEWASATNRMDSVSDEAMIRDILRKSAGARDHAARMLGAGNPEQEREVWEDGTKTIAAVVANIMQSPDFPSIMKRVNARRAAWVSREADDKFMTEGAGYSYDQFVRAKEAEFDNMTPIERIMRTGR